MILTVEVTEQHIKKGAPADLVSCPIALALNQLGYLARVSNRSCIIGKGEIRHIAYMPDEAVNFIADFDDYTNVQPITFDLEFEKM